MIFNVLGHIDIIRNGTKMQTRRLNRGIYQIGKDYAVQRKRGVKAEPDIRIVMDRIWEEDCLADIGKFGHGGYFTPKPISEEDARKEGGYTSEKFEKLFKKLNPNWNGIIRYAFEFHVMEVRRNIPGITSHVREERVERTFYPEQTAGYPRL